jgi:two-component system sensor histidine kinase RpfC
MIRNIMQWFLRGLQWEVGENNSEREQAVLRIFIALLIFIYLGYRYFTDANSAAIAPVFTFSGAWLLVGAIFAAVVLKSQRPSEIRQLLAMLADISAVSFGMLMTEETGVLFFGIYIWVTIGNGIRYGARSLILSQVLSITGFSFVLLQNPFWAAHHMFAAGLMLILVMIPLYTFKLLERLNHAIRVASEASRAKSIFLANMSHEMRTPLNGVIGVAELILETPLSAEQKDLVQTLRNSGHILLKLIEGVLDLSRIESGKLVSEAVEFDLHGMVNGTMDMFTLSAEKKGLQLQTHFSPETCFMLRGNAQYLRQVIVNLVGNAIKFTHAGSVELRVGTVSQDETTARLRFEVADTGIGIAQTSQQSIFESFTQANAGIAVQYGGTGLGTAISKQLVEFMGGQIGLNSEEGRGSTFWFELPFEKQPESRTLDVLPALGKIRVIVAGLSAAGQEAIAAHLNEWKVRFDQVSSVARLFALISKIQAHSPQPLCILCDPTALGMSAQALAERIWKNHSPNHLSLILIDADLTQQSEEDLLNMGYACLLKSPVDRSRLFNALHGVLSAHTSADDVLSFMEQHRLDNAEQKSLSILVAEDNGTNRMILSKILARAGHIVDLTVNGEQALDALEKKHYDLAIMDMHMPVMGGLAALKIYRATEPSPVSVIILTANATTEAMRECKEAGADAFLTKPIDAARLLNTVARLASGRPGAVADAPAAITGVLLNEQTLRHLLELGDGQYDFLESVVHGFLNEGERMMEAMDTALSRREYMTLKELAHAIKGSAGNVGAEALLGVCREIMQASHADLQHSAESLLNEAAQKFSATRVALIQYLEKHRTNPV